MSRSISNETPEKSIICALQYSENKGKDWVDYYVTDEKKFSELGERYIKEKWGEEKWGEEVEIVSEMEFEEAFKTISKIKMWDILDGSYIVFNSCLYRIGGSKRGEGKASKRVSKLDLKNMDSGWVTVAEMNNKRYNPYPVILDGKLYVVGGVTSNPAEELDVKVVDDEEDDEEEEEEDAPVLMEVLKTPVLMEVLKSDESGWVNIPNPDLTVPPPAPPDADYFVAQDKNEYFRYVFGEVLVGAVERKTGEGFIIVAFHTVLNEFELYTYEAEAEAKNNWKPYTKLSSKDIKKNKLNLTCMQPTVMWDHVMLFLGQPHILYVMDVKTGKLHTINLVHRGVINGLMLAPTFLVMIEPGKFCVFWVGYSPVSAPYSVLKGCTFTLRRNKSNTFSVTNKSDFFSLIPNTFGLQALFLVDYIPDMNMNMNMDMDMDMDMI